MDFGNLLGMLFAFGLLSIPFIYVFKWIKEWQERRKKIKSIPFLKYVYQSALRGGDKEKALKAGRDYYGAMRGGILTIYDEQAITNDLAAMK